jgi:hypothetical protein
LPPTGIVTRDDINKVRGNKIFHDGVTFAPDNLTYAYAKTTVHRNLYRIPLPD